MNTIMQNFAREFLKEKLSLCSERQRIIFKKMYSPKDTKKDINCVIDSMPESKLDWAMQQVQRTVGDI